MKFLRQLSIKPDLSILFDKRQRTGQSHGMYWIALAAQLSLPSPDVRTIFSYKDMPVNVMADGINRFVSTRTTIRPDGTPQECTHEGRGSGDPKLDGYTCVLILKRARLRPAKWVDGSPSYAVVRVPVSFSLDGPPSNDEIQKSYPDDMDISVNRLPESAHGQAIVPVVIAVDENGRVVGCDGAHSVIEPDRMIEFFPDLVPPACQQMISQFTAIPAKNASGTPVHSVQTAFVRFKIKS